MVAVAAGKAGMGLFIFLELKMPGSAALKTSARMASTAKAIKKPEKECVTTIMMKNSIKGKPHYAACQRALAISHLYIPL